jgi:hypothetical protein
MTTKLDLKAFNIHLPDGDRKSFLIYGDFRVFLGVKYQSDAVKKIKNSIKDLNLKPQPTFYYEETVCGIQTKNPETIFKILQKLKGLDSNGSLSALTDVEMEDFRVKFVNWKAPKPQRWKVGDIFSLELQDKSYAFGQVVGAHPTVALFDYKSEVDHISGTSLIDKQVITILHVSPNSFSNWSWKINGNQDPMINKDLGPTGCDLYQIGQRSFSPNALNSVANYYWFKTCNWTNENDLKDLLIIK